MKVLCGILVGMSISSAAYADPLACNLSAYKATAGLTATVGNNEVTLTWDGDRNQELRMRFGVTAGTPTIVDLSVRKTGGTWAMLATNVTPDFRVVSGLRRISNQQLSPLRGLGVELTPAIIDKYRWEPFWDAPLDLTQSPARGGNPPPAEGVANQPGLPRKPDEIKRVMTVYKTTGCTVKTNGLRLEVGFNGVTAGVFSGMLQYTVFKGTNLIQQELLAKTQEQWVAYKYDAGLRGLSTGNGARVAWKDVENIWKESALAGAKDAADVVLKAASRTVVAERGPAGSIALFPPPHNFFWAREIAINLGYNWYRKDSDTSFSLGIRQDEKEDASENQANFALYSARPATTQRMTVYLYPSVDRAPVNFDAALAFTHGDHYKPVAGYQVMNHHYHMDLGPRLLQASNVNADIPDLRALKALGINIVSQVDSIMGGAEGVPVGAVYPGATPVTAASRDRAAAATTAAGAAAAPAARADGGAGRRGGGTPNGTRRFAIEGAKAHSDSTFLVMPNQEWFGSPLGGHTDLLFSHPTYWTGGRAPGQPLFDTDPTYGKVYHLGTAQDLMEMAKLEDVLINMPHPRTKGSTGYPDSVKDLPFFSDPHYQGVGFRWGMGLDRSEVRLCDYRCQPLFDDMNNWVADKPIPPKYILSISEVRHQQPGDEIYASSPVTYVKLATLPTTTDLGPVIQALMRGDSFVTSGEVLMPAYAVKGTGNRRVISVDLDWTFPLDFLEVISGDGTKTDRKVISATDLPAMSKKHWDIPFNATGKKWVRFAAWDVAGNGAMSQPVKLNSVPK